MIDELKSMTITWWAIGTSVYIVDLPNSTPSDCMACTHLLITTCTPAQSTPNHWNYPTDIHSTGSNLSWNLISKPHSVSSLATPLRGYSFTSRVSARYSLFTPSSSRFLTCSGTLIFADYYLLFQRSSYLCRLWGSILLAVCNGSRISFCIIL